MGEPPAPSSTSSTRTPADFLKSIKGRSVVVKLNSGADYRGAGWCGGVWGGVARGGGRGTAGSGRAAPTARLLPSSLGVLACLDGYMNIAMEQTEVGGGAWGGRRRRRRRCRRRFPCPPSPPLPRSTSTASSRTSMATRSSGATTVREERRGGEGVDKGAVARRPTPRPTLSPPSLVHQHSRLIAGAAAERARATGRPSLSRLSLSRAPLVARAAKITPRRSSARAHAEPFSLAPPSPLSPPHTAK